MDRNKHRAKKKRLIITREEAKRLPRPALQALQAARQGEIRKGELYLAGLTYPINEVSAYVDEVYGNLVVEWR